MRPKRSCSSINTKPCLLWCRVHQIRGNRSLPDTTHAHFFQTIRPSGEIRIALERRSFYVVDREIRFHHQKIRRQPFAPHWRAQDAATPAYRCVSTRQGFRSSVRWMLLALHNSQRNVGPNPDSKDTSAGGAGSAGSPVSYTQRSGAGCRQRPLGQWNLPGRMPDLGLLLRSSNAMTAVENVSDAGATCSFGARFRVEHYGCHHAVTNLTTAAATLPAMNGPLFPNYSLTGAFGARWLQLYHPRQGRTRAPARRCF